MKAGTRVKLIHMSDPQAPPAGTEGTVTSVDSMGTIHVKWDNGCGLGLIPDVDRYEVIGGDEDVEHARARLFDLKNRRNMWVRCHPQLKPTPYDEEIRTLSKILKLNGGR